MQKARQFKIFLFFYSMLFLGCSINGRITSTLDSKVYLASLSLASKTIQEYGIASLSVTLSKPLTQDLTFTYYTQDSSATAGVDYNSVEAVATIKAGETSVTISVPIVDNYTKATNKKFLIQFKNLSVSGLDIPSQEVEILDDDFPIASGSYFTKISSGSSHVCAVTSAGGLKCWGDNSSGQLGDNTTQDHEVPVDVQGLSSGVVAVSAGFSHTCALTLAGGIKCWGSNASGQLGNNSTVDSVVPVDVAGLTSGVAFVSAGDQHTCAITTSGGAKCWGSNSAGRLGDNTSIQRLTPVDVFGLTSGVAYIEAGNYFTCAVTTAGGAKCWGQNNYGQVGDNSTIGRLAPVDVFGLTSGVDTVSLGNGFACARTTLAGVKCWGLNSNGYLGDNTTTNSLTPVNAVGLGSGVLALSVGLTHSCVIMNSNGVKCWGQAGPNYGDSNMVNRLTAVDLFGMSNIATILSAGSSQTCVLTSEGGMKCWGATSQGQLGNNLTTGVFLKPTDASAVINSISKISVGANTICMLTTSGGGQCFGDNSVGQIGNNTTVTSSTPEDVVGLSSAVAAIQVQRFHGCAVTSSGGAKCWGNNSTGRLGDNSTTSQIVPVDVFGLTSGVSSISLGPSHTCAVTTLGGVKCWGSNSSGQLGDNSTTQRLAPVDVVGLSSGISAVSMGTSHSCALTTSGAVKCWGSNSVGQLGDNSTTNRLVPVDVVGLTSGIIAISVANGYSCALTTEGAVKCWGSNSSGQLGDNSTTNSLVPVNVVGLANGVAAISTAVEQTCALTKAGGVKCWGNNSSGQLGDGTFTNQLTPIDVLGLSSGVRELAIGGLTINISRGCAVTQWGGLKCWGSGYVGIAPLYSPVDVVSP